MVWNLLQVALGGALGSMARYLVIAASTRLLGTGFPWGVLFVNVVGSMIMGGLVVWLEARGLMRLGPLFLTGLMGGFTTFSAFSLDVVALVQNGGATSATVYILASVALSVLALLAGMALMRGMVG